MVLPDPSHLHDYMRKIWILEAKKDKQSFLEVWKRLNIVVKVVEFEDMPITYEFIVDNWDNFSLWTENTNDMQQLTPEAKMALDDVVTTPSPEPETPAFTTPSPPVPTPSPKPVAATTFGPKFNSKDLTRILKQAEELCTDKKNLKKVKLKKGLDYLDHNFKVVNGTRVVQVAYNDKGKQVGHEILTIDNAKKLVNKNRVGDVNLMQEFMESPDYDQYEGIVFDPANSQPEDVINTFYGLRGQNFLESGVTPDQEGLAFMLEHLKGLCGDREGCTIDGTTVRQYDVILDLLAFPIQNPGKKSNLALVVKGAQGCGKSMNGACSLRSSTPPCGCATNLAGSPPTTTCSAPGPGPRLSSPRRGDSKPPQQPRTRRRAATTGAMQG